MTSRTSRSSPLDGAVGWDAYAPFYDWENARTVGRRDVRFWQQLATAADAPVLELGCGTGRITAPVARVMPRGRRLVGIDLSVPMLARARQRLRRGRLRAALVRGDIRSLPMRAGVFGLVMAPYGILQSLLNDRDLDATLGAAARVSRRGATFALDLVPDLPRWSEYRRRVSLEGRAARGAHLTLVESVTQDRAKHLTIFDQEYIVRRGRARDVHRFSLAFRTLSVEGVTRRLARAGFRVDAVLGDYRGAEWHAEADVWVVLARKR